MIADRKVLAVIAPLRSRCSVCLESVRRLPHVKRSLIGQLWNSALVCRYGKRKGLCDFDFLTSSGGKFYKFFMTVVLAIPPSL